MTGVSKKTVTRLLVEAGTVAAIYQDRIFLNLSCRRLQFEMWAFIGTKQENVTSAITAKNPNAGDVWLWVAIDANSKLVPCWTLGARDAGVARGFVDDLASRLRNRVQLTTDATSPILKRLRAPLAALWTTRYCRKSMVLPKSRRGIRQLRASGLTCATSAGTLTPSI